MPRKPLTEDEKSVVREKAAAAARRIMDEHGAEKVTIRGIAKEVGMSAMSLYTYFENKADIIAYLQSQAVDELAVELAAAKAKSTSPEKVVAALGDAYIAFAEEKADEFRLAFRAEEGRIPDAALESLEIALQPLREAVAKSVKEARSPDEIERIVTGIWSGWHGYALLRQAGCVDGQTPVFDAKTAAATFGIGKTSKSSVAAAH